MIPLEKHLTTIVTDRDLQRDLRRHRRRTGADRWDEVWNEAYVMLPMPNLQHQELVGKLYALLAGAIDCAGIGRVFPGVNVSDQPKRWKKNFRCPDVAVYLPDNPAEDCNTHWFGGPDLAIEIVSPGEDPHAKLDFYAKVGTRELLIVNRDPWTLELFPLVDGTLQPVGTSQSVSDATCGETLRTNSVPFTWRLVTGEDRPRIEVVNTDSGQVLHA